MARSISGVRAGRAGLWREVATVGPRIGSKMSCCIMSLDGDRNGLHLKRAGPATHHLSATAFVGFVRAALLRRAVIIRYDCRKRERHSGCLRSMVMPGRRPHSAHKQGARGCEKTGEDYGPEPAHDRLSRSYRRDTLIRIKSYTFVIRRRSAFPTTLTELSAIAAAAMTGDSSRPKAG